MFAAWLKFKKGKADKNDIQAFTFKLEENIFKLQLELINYNYHHSNYISFYLCDPKLRHIHKARVRDRILHQAIVNIIEPIFESTFIFDSYSSRKQKGLHKAVKRFHYFAWKLSRNNTKKVWILKCDIKKFFDNINHAILLDLVAHKIRDHETTDLIKSVIASFNSQTGKGIPLGNLTSQLFSNIYLNKLDQFAKRVLKAKYYIRYADDFVILSCNRIYLENILSKIGIFLQENLKLQLHQKKVIIKKWNKGIDFLGYIDFPHFRIVRSKTKRRMTKRIIENAYRFKNKQITYTNFNQSFQSYWGVLKHCRSFTLRRKIVKQVNNILNNK